MTILAAIDASAAAGPVLHTASALGRTLVCPVVALHVRQDGVEPERLLAARAGVELRLDPGRPAEAIVAALTGETCAWPCSVCPATRPGAGRREAPPWPSPPAPPCRSWWSRRTARPLPAGLRRILVPLDGTAAAARVVEQAVQWFAGCGVQIVGVLVFDAATVPRFWDRPEHDPAVWSRSREFLARNLEAAGARLELGSGWPYERILDVAAAERADMIALAWRRQVAPDRAAVVREVLTRSPVPTILLPVPPDRPRQGCTPGPPDPDKAGRSAGAPAVPMAEAQEGGSRPSRDRGGDEP